MFLLKYMYMPLLIVLVGIGVYLLVPIFHAHVPLIPREVLFGTPEKTAIAISPDGTMVAYLAPLDGVLNVWIKRFDQQDSKPVTYDTKRGIHQFKWAENNRYILYVQDRDGDENYHLFRTDIETLVTVDMTPFPGIRAEPLQLDKHFPHELLITMNREDPKLFDVYHLDLQTGELTLAAKNPGDVDSWIADANFCVRAAVPQKPDGGKVLLVRDTRESAWVPKLTWGLEDGDSQPLGFSRDGAFLYLNDSSGANTLRLVKLNLATGQREIIAADPEYDCAGAIFNNDSYEPELIAFLKTRIEFQALTPTLAHDLSVISKINTGTPYQLSRSADNTRWVVGFVHDDGPTAYYLFDSNSKKSEFLFYDNLTLANYTLAPMKPISYRSRDGLTIHGYLTCPPKQLAKNLPMVLLVHGGPWMRDVWWYNPEAQWLANRGYACLQVNFRGSTGYGKEFMNAGNREFGGKMHDDLIDAVNWAIKEGITDPAKIAIFGASYGGYAALVGATFTPDVFRCAVDAFGESNLITALTAERPYGGFESMRALLYKRIGNPETEIEFLKSRSPLFNVDQIKIPLLIAQGANDPNVLQTQSEQMVAALRAKGLPCEYLLFPDEGHGFVRPENKLVFYAAAEKFLAKYLGGRYES